MKQIYSEMLNNSMQSGITDEIIFGWREYAAERCRVMISEDDFFERNVFDEEYDSLLCDNKVQVLPCLKEQEIYYYRIYLYNDKNKDSAICGGRFITGLKEWSAKWITNNTKKPFYARKDIKLESKPEKAVMCVCGLGQFDLKVNGISVSDDVLKGAWTDYNKHIMYYTYDIASLLKKGDNEIFAEIANGWFIGDTDNGRHFYTMDKGYKPFGECLAFICEIDIAGVKIVSDQTWKVLKSATTLANVYGSEDYDNLYYDGIYKMQWENASVLKNSDIPEGKLIPMTYPPVIIKKSYGVKSVSNPSEYTYILDFGQNMSGMFEITVKGHRGDKIKVTPVEKLDKSGNIEKTTDTWSVYTLSGKGEEKFCPKFSYVGARWIQVENCTMESDESTVPQILDAKGHFITSGAEDTGYFRCSDENYNKIFDLILKAVESNLNHCHTDCPTIEKLGWLEPNHLMAKGIMYCKNVDTLWNKIAMDMRDAQYTKDEFDVDKGIFPYEYKAGLIPNIAPRYAKFLYACADGGSFWDCIPWGSSLILAAWEQYLFYGNSDVLEKNYSAAKRYISYLTDQYNSYNSIFNKNGKEKFICSGLGDWGIEQNKGNSRENVETAFYFHDLDIMSKIAEVVGNHNDMVYYSESAQAVKNAYNESLLKKDPDTGLWCYRAYDREEFVVTQPDQAIPLCFNMVPDEYIEDVKKSLDIACRDAHFHSGEIGLSYIIRSLSEMGRNDIIHNMIMQEEHPSYIRFVRMGETTLPEFWRDDARSRNHDMMGHILEWFFTEVGGIKSYDGFNSVMINTELPDNLEWVECSYKSVRGNIYVRKERGHDPVIKVSDNIKAQIK